ncbi:hypothetical protein GACE_0842 [Geoglobus acetivorans]|uniref:Uncharacterized protein n=1 Tax=Geoglobus acetivorans TaxID=565033 RepID=A0A0A7GG17_GEOAI|nr:hypothetical protein GACE_0842 [Geoglobus acetivorans]
MPEQFFPDPLYEVIEKVVKDGGNSGRVYVPKAWVGKKVKIILLEPLSD